MQSTVTTVWRPRSCQLAKRHLAEIQGPFNAPSGSVVLAVLRLLRHALDTGDDDYLHDAMCRFRGVVKFAWPPEIPF